MGSHAYLATRTRTGADEGAPSGAEVDLYAVCTECIDESIKDDNLLIGVQVTKAPGRTLRYDKRTVAEIGEAVYGDANEVMCCSNCGEKIAA